MARPPRTAPPLPPTPLPPTTGLPTVSAVLVVKDEEAVLRACLEALAWADEVVVYDTGSSDGTLAIAHELADRVVEGYWDDDFGAARNRALAHATGEWVLSVDADEVFSGDPARVRRQLARSTAGLRTLMLLDERGHVDGADIALPRLFRRTAYRWVGALHESPVPLPGSGTADVSQPLPGVGVRHSGYRQDVLVSRDKVARNVAISRAELEDGLAAGVTGPRLAQLHVNLARSLVLTGRHAEVLEHAGRALDAGAAGYPLTVLAQAAIMAAAALPDEDAVDRWLDVWEGATAQAAFPLRTRALVARRRDRPGTAVEVLERMPTVTVGDAGARVDRRDLADVAVWAYAALGRPRDAQRVALEAVETGRVVGRPGELLAAVGERTVATLVARVPDEAWVRWAAACAADGSPGARAFLAAMQAHRPTSGAVLQAAAVLAPEMDLEEAVAWSAHLRRAGVPDGCPLVVLAADPGAPVRDRALAGALAWDVYRDERALAALEGALALVAPGDAPALAAELELVAPGLVSAGA
ncbi:glycosyltransferase family 2 protein [Cellulomonas endophytica]|uniref:glycosyltransferase family 2 protein n=1 Tax=Cellulomonas endophytica TaxID=2494735 RepID=UPI001010C582|nr:glycosyltransferase family 2 protein [Cellulomonas endophytica]